MNKLLFVLLGAILIAGFGVRLYKIDNPIADWHSWRQADTSAVTRNFVRYGLHAFTPRFDDFSDLSNTGRYNPSGFRMVEFPAFNVLHYALNKAIPHKSLEYAGRMTSVIASLVSAVFIFKIVRRHTSAATGLLAMSVFLFLPYNIYFSRTILPDPLMVTLYLGGLYMFDLWAHSKKNMHLIVSVILTALSILVKPIAVFFLLPIVWQIFKSRNIRAYVAGFLMILPFILWRIWVMQFPEGVPSFLWLLNGNGIRFKGSFFRWIFGERLATLILGRWGILLLGLGVGSIFTVPYFVTWLVGALAYVVLFATGNVQHDYYQIPMIPIIAILVALGFRYLWKFEHSLMQTFVRRGLAVVSLIFMFTFSWYDIRGFYQVNNWSIMNAGMAAQRITPENAVILAPYGGDTALLYQTNRRGFPRLPLNVPVKDLIDRFGASYLVSVNYDEDTRAMMNKYTVVESTPEYVIVKLEEPRREL